MKEILAFIRSNKLSQTKNALTNAGFPAYTCRKVMGRGKKRIDPALLHLAIEEEEISSIPVGEYINHTSRLVPKRLFTIIVQDEEVRNVIETIIEVNSEGNQGDGKIFVLPIYESIRVRDGQLQTDSETY
ncbi:P-II family nitrogen regulator [Anaerosacchariphilus polymeriproducens]|uniref:P-II family nitrogen regulator n=1 Tax=Anaerosacchariphilus polymeriproducens TaxID=1812858 RepID=A0A371AUA2_9FIRM|nr:P-II family nitrogen regulator [Anaerosacchariphilus polymeriproducens]RDU23145.1 P-II family nitrogen regulator [Anaerosacchariphilus polymeriproducens]